MQTSKYMALIDRNYYASATVQNILAVCVCVCVCAYFLVPVWYTTQATLRPREDVSLTGGFLADPGEPRECAVSLS